MQQGSGEITPASTPSAAADAAGEQPPSHPLKSLEYPDAELVFGLVGAVGTDLGRFQDGLQSLLLQYGYQAPSPIRVSSFLDRISVNGSKVDRTSEYSRIRTSMTIGTELRESQKRGDVLALYSAGRIAEGRAPADQPQKRRAHIINSLKHPDEVVALRRIYGAGFFLIGVYSPEDDRRNHLVQRYGMKESEAEDLIRTDEAEGPSLGQKTRDTFHLADVFVNFRAEENTNKQLERFLDLVFGDPFQTPTEDEHWMFLAFASALRSADLSRQVGAAIVSRDGDLLATGANDVPKHGGGFYWPGPNDRRDFVVGYDSNEVMKQRIVEEVHKSLPDVERTKLAAALDDSLVANLTEFGRPVHAEMDAIISCARSGVSPRGGVLYTTTFPCHNCAKHIVHAGISRVIYVEPYAKSRAEELYRDSIAVDEDVDGRVCFRPFVGVGPRRYFDLFSLRLGSGYEIKRKKGNAMVSWNRSSHRGPRIPMSPISYINRELLAVAEMEGKEMP
jgi:deoxycytidylate deaminase